MSLESRTERPFGLAQALKVRTHTFRADVGPSRGSTDSAPGPHDLFDASLAAGKALTAAWYARQKGITLERVEVQVERDDSQERHGKYLVKVRRAFQTRFASPATPWPGEGDPAWCAGGTHRRPRTPPVATATATLAA